MNISSAKMSSDIEVIFKNPPLKLTIPNASCLLTVEQQTTDVRGFKGNTKLCQFSSGPKFHLDIDFASFEYENFGAAPAADSSADRQPESKIDYEFLEANVQDFSFDENFLDEVLNKGWF